jgi:hypothetical protein
VNGQLISNILNSQDITFVAEKSGNYTVLCFLEDAAGKTSDEANLFFIYDVTPPTLEMKGEVPSTATVGAKFVLPGAKATDNDGAENVDIQVCVLTPSGRYVQVMVASGVEVEGATSYDFTEAGDYKVRYIATDKYGNYAVKEFTVTCGG